LFDKWDILFSRFVWLFLKFSISCSTHLLCFVLLSLIRKSLFYDVLYFSLLLAEVLSKLILFVSVSSPILYFWYLETSWKHLVHSG
jgi:hypothetical protein